MSVLDEIVRNKIAEVAAAKRAVPAERLRERAALTARGTRGFRRALENGPRPVSVIAELKKRSPSKGLLRKDFDPVAIARDYERNGASALSVLTDEKYFEGKLAYLAEVRSAVGLPLLRKDFIVDEYQIAESAAAGADAVLLIAAVLDKDSLRALHELAAGYGMDALVEVHEESELAKLEGLRDPLVGVNNRDLRTFKVDLAATERIARALPKGSCIVSESGVKSREDALRMAQLGARAVLVGEGLIARESPGAALKELLG